MRILQITNSFYPVIGGQEKVVIETSKKLVEKGHEVTVLTSNYLIEGPYKNFEDLEGIKIIRLKNTLWLGGYGYVKDLKKWLMKNYGNFDIAHCHGYNRYMAEFSLKFLKKRIPLIFSPHGFIHTKKNMFFKKIHDKSFGRLIKKADMCTALTKLDYNFYNKLGVEKNKILDLPNGIDIEKFSKNDKNIVSQFKKKFGIKKDFLLYVGRIHESKGLQYVVDAIKSLDIQLIIIGTDSGYKESLEKKIRMLNLQNKIKFIGPLEERYLISAYKSCKAFVLFSEWEGFGIVVIEAMAAGKPVIVSNRGSLPHLVKDGKNGIVVKFKDVKDLKDKIKFILENEKEAKKIAKKGKEFSKDYSWKKIINKLEKIYEKVRC
jgi:glycosyltransferase involved in cell wall biosynthesis